MRGSKTLNWKLLLAALFCIVGVWGVLGYFWADYRSNRDVERLQRMIASFSEVDPAYSELKAVRSTNFKVWIMGTVESPAHIHAVQMKVAQSFDAEEARRIVSQIRLPMPATRSVDVR
jgi:hypothetical protein